MAGSLVEACQRWSLSSLVLLVKPPEITTLLYMAPSHVSVSIWSSATLQPASVPSVKGLTA